MSKVIAAQIDHILRGDKFIRHKKNAKGTTAIYSRNHPTVKFVRVVVDSGIGERSGKVVRNAGVKLCYINRQKNWREITTEISTDAKGLASLITKVEAAEKFVKSCKFCKAKKFKAKTGNTVCANACWTTWGGKKKAASSKKKTSQPTAQKKAASPKKKSSQKKPRALCQSRTPHKSSQKKLQKIVAEILPGDLVTVEEIEFDKVTTDYTGKVLGIVMKVDSHGRVEVNWTVDNSGLPEWDLPDLDHYSSNNRRLYRFKVLSRKAEWSKAA